MKATSAHLRARPRTSRRADEARPAALVQTPVGPSLERATILRLLDVDHVLLGVAAVAGPELLEAELAVPGYAPEVGDGVVFGRGSDAPFVLGVLGEARRRGSGLPSALRVTSDADGRVELSATGTLSVHSAVGIELVSPLIRSAAGRVETEATVIVELAESSHRRVTELASLTAGRARTTIEREHELTAERTSLVSVEDTTIDGKRVLLG